MNLAASSFVVMVLGLAAALMKTGLVLLFMIVFHAIFFMTMLTSMATMSLGMNLVSVSHFWFLS